MRMSSGRKLFSRKSIRTSKNKKKKGSEQGMARVRAGEDTARATHRDRSSSKSFRAGGRAAGVADASREQTSLPAPTTLICEAGEATSPRHDEE